jgi:SAM-dependent methyltransferase
MHDTDLTHATPSDTLGVNASARCWTCDAPATIDPAYPRARLYRCPSCRLLFAPTALREQMAEEYDAAYFDEYPGGEAYDEDEAQRRYEARLRVELVRGAGASGRLLEVGSARGYFLEVARDAGFDVQGIEPAEDVAAAAAERFGVPVFGGLLEDASLEPASFDVVCAWHVVEHIVAPLEVLRSVRRALRPGGLLVVEVPNVDSVAARRERETWFNLDLQRHVGHYGPGSLSALLERAGFRVEHVETFPPLGYQRPGRALRPKALAHHVVELGRVRALPRRAHPRKHELLRAVARVQPS